MRPHRAAVVRGGAALAQLIDPTRIWPAIDHSRHGEARIDSTITANVELVRSRLASEPDLAGKVAAGDLAIVGARYEIHSQLVRALPRTGG